MPDRVAHVVPAGPPAAVLLAAVAPDLISGWPSPMPDSARASLAPEAAKLPQIPRLSGRDDAVEKIKALHADPILDYGTVSPRYAERRDPDVLIFSDPAMRDTRPHRCLEDRARRA
jgi:iron complex transport system substrate-binding protein